MKAMIACALCLASLFLVHKMLSRHGLRGGHSPFAYSYDKAAFLRGTRARTLASHPAHNVSDSMPRDVDDEILDLIVKSQPFTAAERTLDRKFSKHGRKLTAQQSEPDGKVADQVAFDRNLAAEKPDGKTVVIAAAINYDLVTFTRFIVPLRRVYDGAVVLFVNADLPSDILALCSEHNIDTRELPKGEGRVAAGKRYVGYAEVCADYELCFATDFRDVFFQANPFVAVPSGADLILQEESATMTIKQCKPNSNWIRTCWGDTFLNEIGHHHIICSGTIMGTPRGFEELKKKMLSEEEKCTGTSVGQDQGRMNYLYYSQSLEVPVVVQPRGKGIVNTVGHLSKGDLQYWIAKGMVMNDDGSESAVVHQYDRHPVLDPLLTQLIQPTTRTDVGAATPISASRPPIGIAAASRASPRISMEPARVQALRDTKALYDEGILTEAEFQAKKTEILAAMA